MLNFDHLSICSAGVQTPPLHPSHILLGWVGRGDMGRQLLSIATKPLHVQTLRASKQVLRWGSQFLSWFWKGCHTLAPVKRLRHFPFPAIPPSIFLWTFSATPVAKHHEQYTVHFYYFKKCAVFLLLASLSLPSLPLLCAWPSPLCTSVTGPFLPCTHHTLHLGGSPAPCRKLLSYCLVSAFY